MSMTTPTGRFFPAETQDSLPNYDPNTKHHYWAVICFYKFNPFLKQTVVLLSHDALVETNGPGCWFCDMQYIAGAEFTDCNGPVE